MFVPDPNEVPELKLRIIPTAEGYYDALLNQYVYNFTDHLGNVRLSYTDIIKDGVIQPRQYSMPSVLIDSHDFKELLVSEMDDVNSCPTISKSDYLRIIFFIPKGRIKYG